MVAASPGVVWPVMSSAFLFFLLLFLLLFLFFFVLCSLFRAVVGPCSMPPRPLNRTSAKPLFKAPLSIIPPPELARSCSTVTLVGFLILVIICPFLMLKTASLPSKLCIFVLKISFVLPDSLRMMGLVPIASSFSPTVVYRLPSGVCW